MGSVMDAVEQEFGLPFWEVVQGFAHDGYSAAKRIATRDQVFAGTVLQIHDTAGNILSTKQMGRWEDSSWV